MSICFYRAIYFFTYANSKHLLLDIFKEEKPLLHICAAIIAGESSNIQYDPQKMLNFKYSIE